MRDGTAQDNDGWQRFSLACLVRCPSPVLAHQSGRRSFQSGICVRRDGAIQGGSLMAQTQEDSHIYGAVNSLEDLRRINQEIRREMDGVTSQAQLTELKKRSDYLC